MEEICSSETSVDTQRTTRRYIPEDGTLAIKHLHNFTFYVRCYEVLATTEPWYWHWNQSYPGERMSKLLLALSSTIPLGLGPRRDTWPNFCSFQIFTCFKMGHPLEREEGSDYCWSLPPLLGGDSAGSHSHSLTHSVSHSTHSPLTLPKHVAGNKQCLKCIQSNESTIATELYRVVWFLIMVSHRGAFYQCRESEWITV
jgi:hypothetical protein